MKLDSLQSSITQDDDQVLAHVSYIVEQAADKYEVDQKQLSLVQLLK